MNQKIKISLFIPLFVLSLVTSCVKNEVTGITMSKLTMDLNIAQTDSLIATIQVTGDINKFPVTWTSSDQDVVTVIKGKIQGVSTGKATITAKSGNLTAVCEVNVTNEIYPSLNAGYMVYFGGKINPGISNLFEVALAGPTDTLYIFINASSSATDALPIGEYKLMTSLNSEADFVPLTIIPGIFENGIQYDSWYIGILQSPITNGKLKVTDLTNNVYTIEVDFVDENGNNIYGNYVGKLKYFDDTTLSAVPSLKNQLKNSKQKFN